MATEMERKLIAALEAGDSEELQRLCGEVGSNIWLEVGGFDKQDFPFEELRMPLAHHVACKPVSSSCLELLIDRFGTDCLTHGNYKSYGETPVHLAAQHQDESWMKLVKERGGRGCLRIAADYGKTVAHFAAMNRKSNSCLKWLVKELGSDCLTVPDQCDDTAVHLAAEHQGIESLELIKRQIGTDCFRLKGGLLDRTAFHFAAQKSDNSNLKWLVNELGSDCLTVPDSRGDTAVHLAAEHQGIESLELIKRQIGTDCFRLKGGLLDRTAFHFAAQKSDNSNLKWLVNELGSDCLTVPDSRGDTAVHLAAEHQGIESLEWIKRQIGTDCFRLKGLLDRTAFHFAAKKSDNSNLKWLVKELGNDCLTVPDEYGNTAVHLAAQWQPVDSLQFIFDQIGAEMFSLKNNEGETPADYVENRWCYTDESAKRAWISSTQRRLEASRPPAGSSAPTAASAGPSDPPFLERWDVVRLIGRGGFGEVHEVRTDTGVTCAAKTLRLPVQLGDELPSVSKEIHRAVESERNLCRLRHPNIVRFLHIAQPEPTTVVVFMELLDGRSLEKFIDKPLDELTIRDFSEQICRALLYLHSRQPPVIHRDINCSNMIVCADNTRIKLIDFGLSIKLEQSVSHMSASTQAPKGTLNFTAPELLGAGESDSVQYSRESDIWAFGCSVFQMASGARPFANAKSMLGMAQLIDRRGAPALPDGRSAELRDFYSRCTAKDRRQRKAALELLEHEFLRKNL
ncbi:hypothetical protein BOX15_Mlig029208g1 [Macrostomum lignano]|uniref:Protein kinase domain-containing protein n=2 Tax=Macrostomum lignano TaxID=282301 RepID=A0A267E1T5_9PLAT|nr:hypothetical protein BOX15_Mlig029208g1 [Macrostomum lignano]